MKKIKMADPRTTRVGDLRRGQYVDGSPLDDVQYLECKLILKADEFTSPKGFQKYAKLVAKAAEECGVKFDTSSVDGTRPTIREVLFLDSEDFRLTTTRSSFAGVFDSRTGSRRRSRKSCSSSVTRISSRRQKATYARTFPVITASSSRRRRCRWIYLGATKTDMVYRLKGNPPQAHTSR